VPLPADALRNHPTLARYEQIQTVGRGAFGHVFKGVDPTTRAEVAIKVLMLSRTEEVLRRFAREAKALAGLESPYLVRFVEMDFEADPPCLVMEWISGGVLHRITPAGHPGPPEQVRRVARDLLAGLELLHQRGMLHRDVKPANVFLRPNGLAVLGDFGMIGSEAASTISRTGQALGTPKYMPPEVLRGERWTPQADLFALGLTLWEFAAGVHPNTFFNQSLTMFLEPGVRLPSLEEAGGYRNPAAQALVDALLEVEPEARPESTRAALALLGDEAEAAAGDADARAAYRPPPRLTNQTLDEEADAKTQKMAPISRGGSTVNKPRDTTPPGTGTLDRTRPPMVGQSTAKVPAAAMMGAPAPVPPPSRLGPRVAAAAALGALFLFGAVQLGQSWLAGAGRTTGGGGVAGGGEESRALPAGFTPDMPEVRFLAPDELELRWEVPVKAFAIGTARDDEGIHEFSRGPSSRPTRLRTPAPREGSPYRELRFVLEDREGGTVTAALPPTYRLQSLAETARQFLAATRRGAPEAERRRFWAPLAKLRVEGGIQELDPALHQKLDEASRDLGGS